MKLNAMRQGDKMAAINKSIIIKETGTYVAVQCHDRLATVTAKSGHRGPTSASKKLQKS